MASPGVFQYPIQTLIGVERSFTDPLMNPVFYEKLIEKVLTFQLSFIEKMFASAGGKIDFFRDSPYYMQYLVNKSSFPPVLL